MTDPIADEPAATPEATAKLDRPADSEERKSSPESSGNVEEKQAETQEKKDALAALAQEMLHSDHALKLQDIWRETRLWKNCVRGRDIVQWIVLHRVVDRDQAIRLAELLMNAGYFIHRKGRPFKDSNRWFSANKSVLPPSKRLLRKQEKEEKRREKKLAKEREKQRFYASKPDLSDEENAIFIHRHLEKAEKAREKAERKQRKKEEKARNKEKKRNNKSPHKHRSLAKMAKAPIVAGGASGAVAGIGVGAAVGLIGGPFAPISIPAGAAIGGVLGTAIGVGTGGFTAGVRMHKQALKEARELDDVPIQPFITKEDQLAQLKKLAEKERQAATTPKKPKRKSEELYDKDGTKKPSKSRRERRSGNIHEDPFLFPPPRIYKTDEEAFDSHIVMERGMELLRSLEPKSVTYEQVKGILCNFRDLGDAVKRNTDKIALYKGKIYRTACVSRGSTKPEQAAAVLAFWRDTLGVKTLIDFRNKDEKQADPNEALVEAVYPTHSADEPSEKLKNVPRKRFNIPLFTTMLKIRGMFWEGSDAATKLRMAESPFRGQSIRDNFVAGAMNPMGLFGLNKIMLIHAPEQIARVLRVCANEANYPIVFHCSSGKDRTGFITALILTICMVDKEDVLDDYQLSEQRLQPVMHLIAAEDRAKGLSEEFDGTPRAVMQDTLEFIEAIWGSAEEYLLSIGFTEYEQYKLQKNLMSKGLPQVSFDEDLEEAKMKVKEKERWKETKRRKKEEEEEATKRRKKKKKNRHREVSEDEEETATDGTEESMDDAHEEDEEDDAENASDDDESEEEEDAEGRKKLPVRLSQKIEERRQRRDHRKERARRKKEREKQKKEAKLLHAERIKKAKAWKPVASDTDLGATAPAPDDRGVRSEDEEASTPSPSSSPSSPSPASSTNALRSTH